MAIISLQNSEIPVSQSEFVGHVSQEIRKLSASLPGTLFLHTKHFLSIALFSLLFFSP